MTLPPVSRRALLGTAPLAAAGTLLPGCATVTTATAGGVDLPPWYADLEERTFRFFWERTNHANGLVPDRWPSPSFCSIAAVGMGLTAWPLGVERGWITRTQARDLTLSTLRFFWSLPQGEAASGTGGHRGFFYHFLDMETGHRFRRTELSSVDSTLLFLGMLFAAEYFDRDDAAEREIRALAHRLYARADWAWMQNGRDVISMGWHPETGFIRAAWAGYNEAMMTVLLALAAPDHPIDAATGWAAWTRPYPRCWRGEGATRHLAFAPMFGHQYSHIWFDFRGMRDAPMRAAGFDYFENSRRATYAQQAYAVANPMGWAGYGRDVWGLTACDGPGGFEIPWRGERRTFFSYAARGPLGQPDERDDGTIAPTAALGSLPFAPEIVVPCADALRRLGRGRLYGQYGFLDSFNPSFAETGQRPQTGSIEPGVGWVNPDYIAIDQGPILLMAANHRDDFVWRHMRRSQVVQTGLQRAGFTGGWLG